MVTVCVSVVYVCVCVCDVCFVCVCVRVCVCVTCGCVWARARECECALARVFVDHVISHLIFSFNASFFHKAMITDHNSLQERGKNVHAPIFTGIGQRPALTMVCFACGSKVHTSTQH